MTHDLALPSSPLPLPKRRVDHPPVPPPPLPTNETIIHFFQLPSPYFFGLLLPDALFATSVVDDANEGGNAILAGRFSSAATASLDPITPMAPTRPSWLYGA